MNEQLSILHGLVSELIIRITSMEQLLIKKGTITLQEYEEQANKYVTDVVEKIKQDHDSQE